MASNRNPEETKILRNHFPTTRNNSRRRFGSLWGSIVTIFQHIRGNVFSFQVYVESTEDGETVTDFATTEAALILDKPGKQVVLVYAPGVASDGVYDGDAVPPTVTFTKPKEWSRSDSNLPEGRYTAYVRTGESTGTSGIGVKVAVIEVVNTPGGVPLP
jgi:hypothetical protein